MDVATETPTVVLPTRKLRNGGQEVNCESVGGHTAQGKDPSDDHSSLECSISITEETRQSEATGDTGTEDGVDIAAIRFDPTGFTAASL